MRNLSNLAVVAMALAAPAHALAEAPVAPAGARNIVIVHDAFVDGSGWRVVHDILTLKGYRVSVVQQPLTTFQDDVAAANALVTSQTGSVVLVGHGYGGSVITAAGARSKVKALVYVAALQPNVGESLNQLVSSMPAPSDAVRSTRDGRIFFDPKRFATDYAGDLSPNRARYMAISQMPTTIAAFGGAPGVAAWREKPSFGIVATDDRVLSPELQRWMFKRAGSKVTEVKASHAIYISQPEAVASVIEQAAKSVP